ncbi:MAG: hypothetical protein HY317_04005 [Acidobacteria bacterium]|nr:hypothetical protein [Acidobacteriota bacterium]
MNAANGRPAILVGIDTEADDQWTEAGRRALSVRNAERLPALQALFERFLVRPTYLVTHEMACREPAASILRDLARGGRCEIGAHLHPWSSPPYRPEDLVGTYPHRLPTELLERQLRELTETIAERQGVRPTSYRAGRHGFDERSLRILESLGYTVDTSVDPLFNERRKGGAVFAGAPVAPYRPSYEDVRRPGAARILEVPVSAATTPPLPKTLERLYASLPPIPYRGALRRLGIRPVWLRPSYSSLEDSLAFASRLRAAGVPCFNFLFHSSEVLPGGSPYNPDEASVERFLERLERLLAHLTEGLGGAGRTYREFAAEWTAAA